MLFSELAEVSEKVRGTRSRLQKKSLLVGALRGAMPDELPAAVGWLIEAPLCGPLGVGPAQLWELSRAEAADSPSVTLREVENVLDEARRAGRAEALSHVVALFGKLTLSERRLFIGALTRSLRQGSVGGVMILALAELSGRSETDVRRTVLVTGSIPGAARALQTPQENAPALEAAAAVTLFRPLAPMLAASSESIEDALTRIPGGLADALIEWKVDGVRAQVHKKGPRVAVYSRQGHDITAGCGPAAATLASIHAEEAVLDGELILVNESGAPRPFQESFSAIASKGPARPGDRVRAYLFDCLYCDGKDLLGEPFAVRLERLRSAVPAELRMPGIGGEIRASGAGALGFDDARRFYEETLKAGHEGVMVKDLSSPYRLGARGRAWQKVKEFATADLVVLAAEWGSGRRKGWLSNLHLGARRSDGTFCMVGKTFKGLTDELLRWQTAELERLAEDRGPHVVEVRPELVVEIRFNDVQRSPRYPGRIALRFARVVRYRPDKSAQQADTLESLIARLREPLPVAAKRAEQLALF